MAARRLRAGVIATVDEDALVLVAGIGAARASAAAGALAQHGVVGMLSVGVATATVPGLHCGTLLLPSRVAGADGEVLQVDPAWRAAWLARAQGVPVDERPLGEAPRVLEDGDARRRFARDAGVAAADMESAAVLRVAASAGVPAVVLRVVLDEVAVRLPAAALVALEESGAVSWRALGAALLRRPADIAAVLALAFARRRALRVLSSVVGAGRPRPPAA